MNNLHYREKEKKKIKNDGCDRCVPSKGLQSIPADVPVTMHTHVSSCPPTTYLFYV